MSTKKFFEKLRLLVSDRKGVALPEFAIVIFPLCCMFFCLAQVAEVFIGHLALHHAAVVAARCAVIEKGPLLPGKYIDPDAETFCKNAAIAGVGIEAFWGTQLPDITVAIDFKNTGGDHFAQYSDVVTTTSATYMCGVPLGQRLVCGSNKSKQFSFAIALPHEGAMYTLDSDYNGS
ncbi:MAG: hypothetical protein ABI183_03245 [Polyangiaceae bacterium]